jgi:hypothetical protein
MSHDDEDIIWTKPAAPGQEVVEVEGFTIDGKPVHVWFDGVPTAVKKPDELGGERRKVIDSMLAHCPHDECGTHPTQILHLLVEVSENEMLIVAGCPNHGWVWYTMLLEGVHDSGPDDYDTN